MGRNAADKHQARLRDSITWCRDEDSGSMIVSGSHGGLYAAYRAAAAGVRAVLFNDAGVGKDEAGVGGLLYLEELGVPAAAVDTWSARIGDAVDTLERGRVSHVNAPAARLGCAVGERASDAVLRLQRAERYGGTPPPLQEGRTTLRHRAEGPPVRLLDSGALVRPDDAGALLVIGSHGGLPGRGPQSALRADARLAIFHDAGVGIDQAGIGRLDALQQRGIAAATVAADSARIGDAASLYDTGVLSHVNGAARALGAAPGQNVRDLLAPYLETPGTDAATARDHTEEA